jgi:site-specific recombinase XerC
LKRLGFVEVRGKGHRAMSLWLTAKNQDFLRRYLVLEELLTRALST